MSFWDTRIRRSFEQTYLHTREHGNTTNRYIPHVHTYRYAYTHKTSRYSPGISSHWSCRLGKYFCDLARHDQPFVGDSGVCSEFTVETVGADRIGEEVPGWV